MMSKQRCEQLALKLGAIITEPDYIRLEAPLGRTFDGDVHEQVYYYSEGDKAGAWKDLLADLQYMERVGFSVCAVEACEWCDDAEAVEVVEEFERAINMDAVEALSDDQVDVLMAVLVKAGY